MAFLKKMTLMSTPLIPLIFLICIPASFGQPEEIELDHSDVFVDKDGPAVLFPHELHMEAFDCLDCHHDFDASGRNVLDEDLLEEGNEEIYCTSCHDADTEITLKKAFHSQCIDCHLEAEVDPVNCSDCHGGQEMAVVIDNTDAYAKKQRPAVSFSHEKHTDIDCRECHSGELSESAVSLKKEYHTQCIGCHRYLRLSDEAIAPELCGECHKK